MKKRNIVAVIPVYNEKEKVGQVLTEILKYVDKVILIDDGSTDGSLANISGPKTVILRHIINLGQGAALQTGFDYAKDIGSKVIITFDADGQFSVKDIPRMVKPVIDNKADVVFGSRFLGKTKDIPLARVIILKLGLIFTRVFSNISLSDTHNGFRVFNNKALEKINIVHNRWAHPSDIIYQISRSDLRVVERPVTVTYTKYSTRKGQANIEALRIPIELVLRALTT